MPHPTSRLFAALAGAALLCSGVTAVAQNVPADNAAPAGGDQVFHHVLDGGVLDMSYKPDQQITDAVKSFHKTAVNPYDGNAEAIAGGKTIYDSICAACHLKDGTGRIGPNLIDNEYRYPQVATDKGLFEVIYGGAAGAMQAFGKRYSQDDILRVMAYVKTLAVK